MTRHTVFALALLTSIGCGRRQEAEPRAASIPAAPNPKKPVEPNPKNPAAPNPKNPVEPPYSIISDMDESPARREVDVKLSKKVTPEALREIALEVKAKEERPHGRTVIYYYLPAEFPEISGQAWATTHFKPALEVKILGLSKEEEDMLRSLPLDHKGKRIGAWLQDNQYKTLDLIYDVDGAIKIAEISPPNTRVDSAMVELSPSKGRRFRKVKGSNIYSVDRDGNLRISNADGKVFAASRPMK